MAATFFLPLLSNPPSSSSPTFLHPPLNTIHTSTTTSLSLKSPTPQTQSSKRNFITKATTLDDSDTSVLEVLPRLTSASSEKKLKLLSAVSGLNRGLAANEEDLKKADAAAKELEAIGGTVDLSADLDKLQGRWKLIYSSAFSSRTLGGSRPGLPTGTLLPVTLGQVYQRIDVLSKDFDNIAEVQIGAPWPFPPLELTATLAHKFELIGSAKIRIIFEKTSVKTAGTLSELPAFELPRIPDALRQSSNRGSGEFEVTYVDADTRITRGDREELRVFVIA